MTPPALLRAFEVLRRLPDGVVVGAELGVFRGYMSYALLCRPDLVLFMVDNWKGVEEYAHEGYGPKDMPAAKAHAFEVTKYAGKRRQVLEMDTDKAAGFITDGSLDFVFIDADHSYQGCKSDIINWLPTLKKGGLLGGHDYDNKKYPFGAEVKRAVDEAVKEHGWTLDLGRNTTWFVRVGYEYCQSNGDEA